MEGWISLHRKIMDHPEYFSEMFTRMGAWIDLLLIANHKTGYVRKRGIRVEVLRGQTAVSRERLAERWKWSPGKVTRFLNELEVDGQIVQQKTNVINCITICNYDEYQKSSTTEEITSGLARGEPVGAAGVTPAGLLPDCGMAASGVQTEINNNNNNVIKEDNSTHTGLSEDNIFLTRARDFLQWVQDNFPAVQQMREPFTLDQALKVVQGYKAEDVGRVIAAMYNKGATINLSAYATFCSFADNDRIIRERREKGLKLYSYVEMTELLTSGQATQKDFLPIEKGGTRFYMLRADYIRANL